jgi:hypothetical protein
MQILLEENSTAVSDDLIARVSEKVLQEGSVKPSRVLEISFRPQFNRKSVELLNDNVVVALVGDAMVGAHYRLGIGWLFIFILIFYLFVLLFSLL